MDPRMLCRLILNLLALTYQSHHAFIHHISPPGVHLFFKIFFPPTSTLLVILQLLQPIYHHILVLDFKAVCEEYRFVHVDVYLCVCMYVYGLLRWHSGKEPACKCRRHGFSPWVGKIPWRRKW